MHHVSRSRTRSSASSAAKMRALMCAGSAAGTAAGAASSRCQKRTHAGTNRSPTAANSAALHPAAMPPGTDRPGVRTHQSTNSAASAARPSASSAMTARRDRGCMAAPPDETGILNCSTRGGKRQCAGCGGAALKGVESLLLKEKASPGAMHDLIRSGPCPLVLPCGANISEIMHHSFGKERTSDAKTGLTGRSAPFHFCKSVTPPRRRRRRARARSGPSARRREIRRPGSR